MVWYFFSVLLRIDFGLLQFVCLIKTPQSLIKNVDKKGKIETSRRISGKTLSRYAQIREI